MMLRFNQKTKFPKAIDEESQKKCFNKKLLTISQDRNVKDAVLKNILETLPYMKTLEAMDWMRGSYEHPLDPSVLELEDTAVVDREKALLVRKNFITMLKHAHLFPGLARTFPYEFTHDGTLTKNIVTTGLVNRDNFYVDDLSVLSDETANFLKFRLKYPEAVSRFVGGYHTKEFVCSVNHMPEVKYVPEPAPSASGATSRSHGIYSEPIWQSLGLYAHLKVPRVREPFSRTFLVPENVNEFYSTAESLADDYLLETLARIYRTLPGKVFNNILGLYRLKDVWQRYVAIPTNQAKLVKHPIVAAWEANIAAVDASRQAAGLNGDKYAITWNNVLVTDAQGGANQYVDIATVTPRTLPVRDIFSIPLAIFQPAGGAGASDLERGMVLDFCTMFYHFGELLESMGSDAQRGVCKGNNVGLSAVNLINPTLNRSIQIFSAKDACNILKLIYMAGHGVNVYRDVIATLGTDYETLDPAVFISTVNNQVDIFQTILIDNQTTLRRIATVDLAAITGLARVVSWTLDQQVPPVRNALPAAGAIQLKTLVPSCLNKLNPDNVEFICKYVSGFRKDELPFIFPAPRTFEPANFMEKDVDPAVEKEQGMFWMGMKVEDWTTMCVFTKALLSKLNIVLGLYNKTVQIGGVSVPVTYCGIYNQLPADADVIRVCFLPHKLGTKTLYESLKFLHTGIQGEMDKVTGLSRLDFRKNTVITPEPKLHMTKTQFDSFMSMVMAATNPLQVLAAYCITMTEKAADQTTVKFTDTIHYTQTLWLLLTKLNFSVNFREVRADGSGQIVVRPPLSAEAVRRMISKHSDQKQVIEMLLIKAMPLIEFLAYPTRLKRDESLSTAKDQAGAGASLIQLPKTPKMLHDIDVASMVNDMAGQDLLSFRLLQPEYDEFYKNTESFDLDLTNVDDSLTRLQEIIPNCVKIQSNDVSIGQFGPSLTQNSLEQLFQRAENNDLCGGMLIDEILEGPDDDDERERAANASMKAIIAQIDRSLGVRRMAGYSANARIRPFNPAESGRVKYLNSALHGAAYMHEMMTKIRVIESTSGIEVDPAIKNEIIGQFMNIYVANRELYVKALQLDLLQNIIEILRGNGHSVDDAVLSSDTLQSIYRKLKPRAKVLLENFNDKIKAALKNVFITHAGLDQVELPEDD